MPVYEIENKYKPYKKSWVNRKHVVLILQVMVVSCLRDLEFKFYPHIPIQ
jgi:hypothetical protein